MSDSYGWIGKSKLIISSRTQTRTADYIKYAATKCHAEICNNKETGIRTKNLLEKNGTYYYILSIGKGQHTWALSTFVKNKELQKPIVLILTRDCGGDKCDLWIVRDWGGLDIPRRGRKVGGNYDELAVKSLDSNNSEFYENVSLKNNDTENTVQKRLAGVLGD